MDQQLSNGPCPECAVGRLGFRQVAYMYLFGNHLLTVPDFPAWTCGVCGYLEYDRDTLAKLESLLGPTMSMRRDKASRRKARGADRPQPQQGSSRR